MKILEVANFSAGGCGVWARVKKESSYLKKEGHDVTVFSSNLIKNKPGYAPKTEVIDGINIRRFPAFKLGGESFMKWDFKDSARKLNPDVIIAHGYRHLCTTQALKIAKELNVPIFLVTHAPFARKSSRSLVSNIVVYLYDLLIGKFKLSQFTKIIAITHWEYPYLRALGIKKTIYLPNGVSPEYFKPVSSSINVHNIVYTGRIAPIKNLEVVLDALAIVKEKFNFTIFGPADKEYLRVLRSKINSLSLDNVKIIEKTYASSEQISLLDKNTIFILPSLSEGMPQSLIEAMARGKIVVGSNNLGNADIITHEKDGFLFENNNSKSLAHVLSKISSLNKKEILKISRQSRAKAESFKWDDILAKLEALIREKPNS